MLGEDVVNKTVPLILCAEENVVGNHGATIGELDDETLFYFESRGIGREDSGEYPRPRRDRAAGARAVGDRRDGSDAIVKELSEDADDMAYDYREDFPLLREQRSSPISTTPPRRSVRNASSTRRTTSTARHNANPLRGLYPAERGGDRRL